MERDATCKHMKVGLAQVMQISRTKSSPKIKEDSFFFLMKKKFYLFMYLFIWGDCAGALPLCWLFSSISKPGLLSKCGAWASLCSGLSCAEHSFWGMWASAAAACGLSSFGSWALESQASSYGARA